MTYSFNTAELDSTEKLALAITREEYAAGDIGVEEYERRVHAIIGLDGDHERRRVLHTDDVVDITGFGHIRAIRMATAWRWPLDSTESLESQSLAEKEGFEPSFSAKSHGNRLGFPSDPLGHGSEGA